MNATAPGAEQANEMGQLAAAYGDANALILLYRLGGVDPLDREQYIALELARAYLHGVTFGIARGGELCARVLLDKKP